MIVLFYSTMNKYISLFDLNGSINLGCFST